MLKELKREIGLLMTFVMLLGCFKPLDIKAEETEEETTSDVYYDDADEEVAAEELSRGKAEKGKDFDPEKYRS